MDKSEFKTPGTLSHMLLWVLPVGALPDLQKEYQQKIPSCFCQEKKESSHF